MRQARVAQHYESAVGGGKSVAAGAGAGGAEAAAAAADDDGASPPSRAPCSHVAADVADGNGKEIDVATVVVVAE